MLICVKSVRTVSNNNELIILYMETRVFYFQVNTVSHLWALY